MTDDKTYILDPLTCLCKIALLHFMPDKTKLAISNHVMHIQEYSYCQWVERMRNGDSRIDISHLNTPLIRAVEWYIVDGDDRIEMDAELIDSIQRIAGYAIQGLTKLQNCTYQSDNSIRIILQYFINILNDAQAGTWDASRYVKTDPNSVLSEKIKHNFDANTVHSISRMFDDATRIAASPHDALIKGGRGVIEDVNALVDCSHKLLLNRDHVFVKMMKEINTTL